MTDVLDVYLDGLPAGRLSRGSGGAVTFEYAPQAPPTPLSVSMPRRVARHSAEVVMPWLDSLLPDNDDVRARWAASFGARRATPFDLLAHMGADCAGAVQVVPPGRPPDQAGELTPISPAEIGLHIRRLRADAAAWDFPERGGRWSLGGQQGKFALARNGDGEWLLPSGRAASTHIVKVGVSGVPGSDVAEFVTMRAAALLGLPVPPVAFSVFDGESALVATRFDRIVEAGGVRRVHQEDLCQALGLWRTMKYQADGGPSAGAVIDFLRRALDRRDREAGLRDFARAQVFHWIVAGTDAHAKNHAVLHTGSRVTLAPFYDLISTAFLWPDREVHFEGRLAMKFGGEYRLRKVDAGRFDHAAAELGVDESWLIAVARLYRDRLPDVVDAALAELPPTVAPVERARLRDAMAARLEWVCVP